MMFVRAYDAYQRGIGSSISVLEKHKYATLNRFDFTGNFIDVPIYSAKTQ